MTTIFKIHGVVREKESGIGIGNLLVKAYDKDLLYDDLMGSAITRSDGTFEIVSEAEDFRDFFEKRPDIYLRIKTYNGKQEIYSTESGIRWEAGRVEYFKIDIPRDVLGDLSPGDKPRLAVEVAGKRFIVLIDKAQSEVHVMEVGRIPVRKGEELSFAIPAELVQEFKKEARIVIRYPWLIGIPLPEALKPEVLRKFREFDVFLTPRELR